MGSLIKLPIDGFQLTGGLGIGSSSANNLGIDKVSSTKCTIDRVSMVKVPITVEVPKITIGASLSKVASSNITATGTISPLCTDWVAILDFFRARFCVKPTLKTTIGELSLNNLQMRTDIGKLTFEKVQFPFDLIGIELSGVQINDLRIPLSQLKQI